MKNTSLYSYPQYILIIYNQLGHIVRVFNEKTPKKFLEFFLTGFEKRQKAIICSLYLSKIGKLISHHRAHFSQCLFLTYICLLHFKTKLGQGLSWTLEIIDDQRLS